MAEIFHHKKMLSISFQFPVSSSFYYLIDDVKCLLMPWWFRFNLNFSKKIFSTDQSHTIEWCYRDSWATFIVIDNNRFQLEQQFTSSSWVRRTRKYAFPPTFARVNNSLENEIESIFIIFWFWFALQISSLFASVQLKINLNWGFAAGFSPSSVFLVFPT